MIKRYIILRKIKKKASKRSEKHISAAAKKSVLGPMRLEKEKNMD
jgi:hypothetical protein